MLSLSEIKFNSIAEFETLVEYYKDDEDILFLLYYKLFNKRHIFNIFEMTLCLESLKQYINIYECYKKTLSLIDRRKRFYDHITAGFAFKEIGFFECAYFFTFTFNDEAIKKPLKSRELFITRFLKSISGYYMFNYDTGSQFEREHYHAILFCDKLDYSQMQKKYHRYGNLDIELCYNTDSSRIGRYIDKLTNHGFKSTTNQRIHYSRGLILKVTSR